MTGVPKTDQINGHTAQRYSLAGKRIALVTGAYNHIADGVTLTLNRLVAHLEHQGADVRIFAPTIDDPPVDHAGTLVPVRSVPLLVRSEYRMALGLSWAARAQLVAFDPMLIHIATPDFLGRRVLRLAAKWGIPVVSSYHTHITSYMKYYGLSFVEDFLWWYLRRFYRACRHIYVPSESMADVLREHGITEGLKLWQRGVDTTLFRPSRRSTAWRQALGFGDDEVVIAFVGRLVWEKGLHVYADVIEALTARGIPHRSLIVGEGPAQAELTRRLPETHFTGYLDDADLARAYASSDLFLFPSDTETFGNVTLEAMASGLPAVCADATGSRSLVEHGVTGFLAPPGQSSAFLQNVERLVTDGALRERMRKAALQRAQTFAWDVVMDRIVGFYQEILHPERVALTPRTRDEHAVLNSNGARQVLLPSSN